MHYMYLCMLVASVFCLGIIIPGAGKEEERDRVEVSIMRLLSAISLAIFSTWLFYKC